MEEKECPRCRRTYCAFCDFEISLDAPDAPEQVADHTLSCDKHPLNVIIADLQAQRDDLLAVVREVEWIDLPVDPYDFDPTQEYIERGCPVCKGWPDDGHASDCALAAAIARVEGIEP